MRGAVVIVMLGLGLGTARADEPQRVVVEVGKTVEQNVGYARGGWICDDPSLISGELVTRGDTNYWIVTGAKPGTTLCRVGTDRYRVVYMFELVVAPANQRKKPH
jgi:hypothetical protein